MKQLVVLSISLMTTALLEGQVPTLSELQWLSGNWTAIKNKPGKIRTEIWETANAGRMQGFGIVMQGKDTSFLEKMQIEEKDGNLFFAAEVPENKKPVLFKITKTSADRFECENPSHDFPKKIIYQKNSDTLNVTISGNGNSVDFKFTRTP